MITLSDAARPFGLCRRQAGWRGLVEDTPFWRRRRPCSPAPAEQHCGRGDCRTYAQVESWSRERESKWRQRLKIINGIRDKPALTIYPLTPPHHLLPPPLRPSPTSVEPEPLVAPPGSSRASPTIQHFLAVLALPPTKRQPHPPPPVAPENRQRFPPSLPPPSPGALSLLTSSRSLFRSPMFRAYRSICTAGGGALLNVEPNNTS